MTSSKSSTPYTYEDYSKESDEDQTDKTEKSESEYSTKLYSATTRKSSGQTSGRTTVSSKDFSKWTSTENLRNSKVDGKTEECCENLDKMSCSDDVFSIGDLIFVKYNGVMWPGIIEDPCYSEKRLIRNQLSIFLYGIHERIVVGNASSLVSYDRYRGEYGKADKPEILKYALMESRTFPCINKNVVPEHLLSSNVLTSHQDCNYAIMKSRKGIPKSSVTSIRTPSDFTDNKRSVQIEYAACFNAFTNTSIDVWMGRIALTLCGLVAFYMTLWLIVLPFMAPPFYSILRLCFPRVEYGLTVLIGTGSMLISSIVVYVQVQLYSLDDHND